MKILEAQNAVLTNYEVYRHLTEQRERYAQEKRRGPPNLETVVREILQYFRSPPNPLSQNPITYTPECIAQLLESLRPYSFSKAEVIMLFNLRPQSVANLNTSIEDLEDRFTMEQQEAIIDIIVSVLGKFESSEDQPAEGDVSMTNGES
ncbi:hypothetical protein SAPIO_CDS3999 [Scedosporium apiospermum]|uniref:DNA-directed RNA polymerase III subunit RPC9 n=1 Tax=Pseudallescheria apiosperma TaxID=563466 RepID=A0A084G925_PSEDA|nr:uncharacterized protein SAPIO_CDS3999 [Scedosporium apiospermum]KEZ43837.1 hypothetical protein SAPIO_CDS3999 [Scedosporium apiospermum]